MAVLAEDDAMGRAGLAAVTQALADLKLQPLVGSAFVPVTSSARCARPDMEGPS
jgi:hypothetical protein